MKVRYNGGRAQRFYLKEDSPEVKVGDEVEVSQARLAQLQRLGHSFSTVEKGDSLPDPEPAEVLPGTEPVKEEKR